MYWRNVRRRQNRGKTCTLSLSSKKVGACFNDVRRYISIVKPTRCTIFSNLFLFWNNVLHVSDGLSVHHQEFKTVHTATGVCHTDTATCLQVYVTQILLPACRYMSHRYCYLLAGICHTDTATCLQVYVTQILLPACR